jgi:ABC-type multidrug transport system fused ATPase/permease subunit
VRSNLDPFDDHSDQECWDVLKRCHLAANHSAAAGSQPAKRIQIESLDTPIAAGGGSLSAGQRQLLALARAMLRRTQVVLTDEATSAIDLDLDDQVRTQVYEAQLAGADTGPLRFNTPFVKSSSTQLLSQLPTDYALLLTTIAFSS